MSYPFKEDVTIQFSHESLVKHINNRMESLPDSRLSGPNTRYEMSDAGLSAFSVFFMQSPSFLQQQRLMHKQRGINNVNTLFGTHKVPSDNQIRNLMDTVPPDHFYPIYRQIFSDLNQTGYFESFKVLDKQLLIAFDGTDYFSSKSIHCKCCSTKEQKNGDIHYSHTAVTPVILSPNQSQVIPLVPEFVTPQDGSNKQDCEIKASTRWVDRESDQFDHQEITVLGDDLYCHEPFCQHILGKNWNFIFVCKPTSHQTVYEHIEGLSTLGKVHHFKEKQWTGKETHDHHYRFLNDVPIKDGEGALSVNWCEITTTNESGDIIYKNSFATNHWLTKENVIDIITAGRARWKIENENNNTLKTKGYNLKHNFGHGKAMLSSTLATLNILSFLIHTVLEHFDERYRLVRQELGARKTFFDDIRALTRYICFDSWHHLLETMMEGLEIPIPTS
ncbi:MAG: ISNCY family transposase [Methylococcales bacterium]|nr:ISNCY family transposase [Methylococcales bacterium]